MNVVLICEIYSRFLVLFSSIDRENRRKTGEKREKRKRREEDTAEREKEDYKRAAASGGRNGVKEGERDASDRVKKREREKEGARGCVVFSFSFCSVP